MYETSSNLNLAQSLQVKRTGMARKCKKELRCTNETERRLIKVSEHFLLNEICNPSNDGVFIPELQKIITSYLSQFYKKRPKSTFIKAILMAVVNYYVNEGYLNTYKLGSFYDITNRQTPENFIDVDFF